MESIIELVEDEHRITPFGRVCRVRIKVGELAMAEPESLRFCFALVARGTVAEGARLDIHTIRGQAWCDCCRQTVAIAERFSECPSCGSTRLQLIAGQELQLDEIEVE